MKIRNTRPGFFQRLLRAGVLGGALVAASGVLAGACGGASNNTTELGGESHFLRSCGQGCGDGLDCVTDLCTKGCIVGESSCSALAARAACTSASIEPGAVAVCDVDCAANADCDALGRGYRCESGFCRAPALPPGPSGGTSQCPSPRQENASFCPSPSTVWSRDVSAATRTCCQYDSLCVAPRGWPLYTSEQECQADCLCNQIEGGGDFNSVSRSPLECICAGFDCPQNVQAASRFCDADQFAPIIRSQGCGRIEIATGTGFFGSKWVFDESNGLIGMSQYSDTESEPCQTFRHIAGAEFDCADAERCRVCGPLDPTLPDCEVR